MNLVISLIVTVWVGFMLYKKYKAQSVLFFAGVVLLVGAAVLGTGELVPAKQATGSWVFDVFKAITNLFSNRLAGLGLTIMSIGGFVRFMEHCGANRAMVQVCTASLKIIKHPTLIFILAYIIGQIISIFIPSHAGTGLLLMLTMYPILIETGINKITAVALIATAKFTDIGPLSSNAILAANTSGLDPVTYFVQYQLYVVIPAMVVVGAAHLLIQPWWDKREARLSVNVFTEVNDDEDRTKNLDTPKIYAILPMLPLILVVVFSPIFHLGIKIDVVSAMLLSTVVALVFELLRTKDISLIAKSFMIFFEGMSKQFVIVVSLIICAETFARGLVSIGTIDTLIRAAEHTGLSLGAVIIGISIVMVVCAFIMGSGNAAFFAFAGLAPKIATMLSVPPVLILLPMELSAGFGRCMSPITAAIVAISGIAGVSPFHVAKRCAIPVFLGLVTQLIFVFYFFV